MPVADIVLNYRVRKNLGDISTLMQSMQKHGLLNPITVTPKGELIAGHRRLESAKQLGWQYIDVLVVDDQSEIDRLEMEIEENVYRKALSSDELADAYRRLEKMKNPGFFRKLFHRIRNFFKKLFGRGPRKAY
ncbi:MAG: ParB N-terminal domain-containing protein [Spirochaetales bacterium]|nr:ParB N-terminal domain-containing protein [Spirochaetales bacterium]